MRRFGSSGGAEVAVHLLGPGPPAGATPALLVHATGFCAAVMAPLAARLGPRFGCAGVDLRGHGRSTLPDPPGAAGVWDGFADDVLAAVDGLGLERPVGIGHSSGGAAVLMAEAARPGTFSALWCFEPIVWPDPEASRHRAERLAAGARRRRDTFGSRDEALANFAAKPPFSALTPEVLAAYVEGGFADLPGGGIELRCRRELEADVYLRALDDDRFGRLGLVACPVVVACGGLTDAVPPDLAGRLAGALPAGRVRVFEELGHFGPLEDPGPVARAIAEDVG